MLERNFILIKKVKDKMSKNFAQRGFMLVFKSVNQMPCRVIKSDRGPGAVKGHLMTLAGVTDALGGKILQPARTAQAERGPVEFDCLQTGITNRGEFGIRGMAATAKTISRENKIK